MKQAIYVAEVQKTIKLRHLMETMVEVCDVRGADPDLVAELRAMADVSNLHQDGPAPFADADDVAPAPSPGFFRKLFGRSP